MKYIFTILFIFSFSFSYSQKENYNWVFYRNTHINFNNNPPTVDTIPHKLIPHNNSSMSDKDGNLLFYFDVKNLYNFQHQLLLGLFRTRVVQHIVRVVPHPTIDKNFFYISGMQRGIYNPRQVIYLIDMNANNGKGIVSEINIIKKEEYITERFLITRKYNSKDYWFLRFKDNKIIRNTIDASGLKDDTSIENFMKVSLVTISPDMSKLFILDYSQTKFYIADYDYRTAEIKNIKQFKEDKDTNGKARIFEFSRNGNYLFQISKKVIERTDTTRSIAVKYDMSKANNIEAFINSADTLPIINPTNKKRVHPLDASLAPNGKIYIIVPDSEYLLAIEEDNTVDGGYVLNNKSLYLNENNHGVALPHIFNYHVCFNYNLDCNTSTFNYLGMPAQSQHWNFGDGTTSTELNPTHTYSAPGTYTVKLTATYTNNTTQTAEKTITISEKPKKPIIIHN